MFHDDEFDRIFKQMSGSFVNLDNVFEMLKNAGTISGPVFNGYTMTTGPDGKPVVQEYGNVQPDILPTVSLYKTQMRELAKTIGVPNNIITKKSSPNLWKGHDAEEEIGISYEEIDSALYCLIDKIFSVDETIQKTEISRKSVEKIYQMYQNTQHKRILPERV